MLNRQGCNRHLEVFCQMLCHHWQSLRRPDKDQHVGDVFNVSNLRAALQRENL